MARIAHSLSFVGALSSGLDSRLEKEFTVNQGSLFRAFLLLSPFSLRPSAPHSTAPAILAPNVATLPHDRIPFPISPPLLVRSLLVYNNHLAWAAAKGYRNPCNHKSHFARILSARVPPLKSFRTLVMNPQPCRWGQPRYRSSGSRGALPLADAHTHTFPLLPSRILGLSGAWSLPNLTISRVLGSNVALVYHSIHPYS